MQDARSVVDPKDCALIIGITYFISAILSLILAAVCVVGDLAESVLKRCLAIKDSGALLPGIGGALDLIDSLLWTGPVFYFYLLYVCRLT